MRGIEKLEREQEEILAERNQLVQDIVANKITKPVVNCDGLPQCSGSDESQQLFQALIDIINGSGEKCQAFKGPYENAGDLGSPASASEEKEFNNPYFSKVIPAENSAGFSWSLRVESPAVKNLSNQEKVPVVAHLITPYGSNLEYVSQTLQSFFNEDQFRKMVENNCIEDFNGECGLMPEYFTFGGILADLDSGSDSHSFIYDRDPACLELEDPDEQAECQRLSFGGTTTEQPREPLRILGAQIGWMIRKLQENIRGATSKAYEYISSCTRTEDLFLGRCLGYQGLPGGSDSEATNSCNDYQGISVELPSMAGLEKMVCSVARNNQQDAQLLWGLLQIEGSPMFRKIRAGETSVSCSELIAGSCAASQIVGIIVPQCINLKGCPKVAWALDEGTAGQAYRESITNDVSCNIEGSLEFILKTRKSQVSELRAAYQAKWGTQPSEEQLYYMMAGKNLGLDEASGLLNPACEGAPPVQGCGGANYCQCAMDAFEFSCP